jgi:two-component system NtrC family response regulator
VREKRFREDLYFRLNVVPIGIPALRERREDIGPLLDYFCRKYAAESGKAIRGITRDARDALYRYDYPGNVRELENVVERAVVLCRGDVIGVDDLPLVVQEKVEGRVVDAPAGSLPAELEALERRMIEDALQQADGVQTRAAELLGITERGLRYKLNKLGFKESDVDRPHHSQDS